MLCRLLVAKPLPESVNWAQVIYFYAKSLPKPMRICCQSDPLGQPSMEFESKYEISIQECVFANIGRKLSTILFRPHCIKGVGDADDYLRVDSTFATSQWETALHCNNVSLWLGGSLESALYLVVIQDAAPIPLITMRKFAWTVLPSWFRTVKFDTRINDKTLLEKHVELGLGEGNLAPVLLTCIYWD